jgi:hypothetical protein
MCKMASFLYRIDNDVLDVFVSVLDSHSETEKKIGKKNYREGHYTPGGMIECRIAADDRWTSKDAEAMVQSRWPAFLDFISWAGTQKDVSIGGGLSLDGLTSVPKDFLKDVSIGGWLYLNGLTSVPKDFLKGVSIGGWLSLNGLTSVEQERVRNSLAAKPRKG